jgi:hypothetical protein
MKRLLLQNLVRKLRSLPKKPIMNPLPKPQRLPKRATSRSVLHRTTSNRRLKRIHT